MWVFEFEFKSRTFSLLYVITVICVENRVCLAHR
jgi:hypothetical protein